jgi:hypothetical protein
MQVVLSLVELWDLYCTFDTKLGAAAAAAQPLRPNATCNTSRCNNITKLGATVTRLQRTTLHAKRHLSGQHTR